MARNWAGEAESESVGHSVQFSSSVMSYSVGPHGPQHTRPLCPSPTPEVYPNSCPLSRWCHPTISFSVIPFSSCPQCPASGSFQMSQLFASGGQLPTISGLMDYSPPGSSVYGILQPSILEWVAISYSGVSSWPRDQTWFFHTAVRFFTIWATRDAE